MVNRNLKSARRDHERTEPTLLSDINEQLFWRFLARYLAMNLEQRKVVKEADLCTIQSAKRLIGHNRFSALHKRFNPDEQQLTMFITMLRDIILKEITLGTVHCCIFWAKYA